MNTGGDAAEQIVRLSLNGVEVAAKITGSGVKELAAMLYAVLKGQTKTKGKTRLSSLLRSGKELKVFTVKESDIRKFSQEAKRYGVLYCALRGRKKSADGLVDVMVRAEDAPKINRIVERFQFATVDTAAVQTDISLRKEEKARQAPEKDVPDKGKEEKLLDDMLGKPIQKEAGQQENPSLAKTEKSPPSEPSSGESAPSREGAAKPMGKPAAERTSVREELREIKAEQRKAEKPPEQAKSEKAEEKRTDQNPVPQKKQRRRKKQKVKEK